MIDQILELFTAHHLRILDVVGAVLGLVYILLEYRASIYLWLVSIIMPLVDMWLYFSAGLYADFGMAIYYALAAIYGYIAWKWGFKKKGSDKKEPPQIGHIPGRQALYATFAFLLVWLALYEILTRFTNSTVPMTDSFTSALSIIALWALSRKYVEQWLMWLVVDVISCVLYIYKGIPFKAGLYGLYVIIAILGYFKWCRMMKDKESRS